MNTHINMQMLVVIWFMKLKKKKIAPKERPRRPTEVWYLRNSLRRKRHLYRIKKKYLPLAELRGEKR